MVPVTPRDCPLHRWQRRPCAEEYDVARLGDLPQYAHVQRRAGAVGQRGRQAHELEQGELGERTPRLRERVRPELTGGGRGWAGVGGWGWGCGAGRWDWGWRLGLRLAWSTFVSHCARAGARVLSSSGSIVCLRSCLPGSGSRAAASLWRSCVRSVANALNLRKANLPSRTGGM